MRRRVLVVDDEEGVRSLCADLIRSHGLEVEVAEDRQRALAVVEGGQVDIVLTDVGLPGATGIELLRAIKQRYPGIEVVVMTAWGMIPDAVEAVKAGAFDYITKPFDPQGLMRVLNSAGEKLAASSPRSFGGGQACDRAGFGSFIGSSEKIQKVQRLMAKFAPKRLPVLIMGESGTGKELVAREIHARSPWHDQPFVPIDCGALTATLIESELFGHVRGAFTGATQSRRGLLAIAGAGTVFLDEIAELPVELQVKLLRALQEREIKPVGSNERVRLEARVIAASNQDLEAAVERGTFRKDLYFRLNVLSIKLPPLRERKSDIPLLVRHFIERHGGPESRISGFSPEATAHLMSYDWPGNVRELENCVQRALAIGAEREIQVSDLPSNLLHHVARASSPRQGTSTLQALEQRAILQALEATGGDRLRAAKLLGIGKSTIYRKLKEYGLEDDASVSPSC